jgi:hypothetical protein
MYAFGETWSIDGVVGKQQLGPGKLGYRIKTEKILVRPTNSRDN